MQDTTSDRRDPFMLGSRYTPEKITSLKEGEVIVYGSNDAGINGGGAAWDAKHLFGAIDGIGEGMSGQFCYALPTKDAQIKTKSLLEIKRSVRRFYQHAFLNPNITFYVTKFGTGLAGYSIDDIAKIVSIIHLEFWEHDRLCGNIILPIEFAEWIKTVSNI